MRRLPFLALIISLSSLVACHKYVAPTSTAIVCTTSTTSSSSSCADPVTGISIAIAPATISVSAGTPNPTQFLVGVSGGTNNIVTWKVNDVTGGNDTVGRIDSNGLYRAPALVPSPATVNVSVVSFEDPKLSATSVATILPPPTVTISPACTLTPCMLTSGTANTITFTSTVTGAPTTDVDWQVNGVPGGNDTFGKINAAGVFTAPLTPPLGTTVNVTAVSHDFPLAFKSATVTISGYSTSSFKGQFAFSMSGNASGAFFRAGSFSADGAGNLSGGLEDVNAASCGTTNPISFVGTYTISSDGRGTMQFADGCTPSTFSFVLVNNDQLQITGFDTAGTAAGQANSQDASAFNASGLFGTYAFDFAGLHGSSTLSQIGEFTSDGLEHIANGLIDTNDGGAISPQAPFVGAYVVNSNGRGTATFGSLTFSFYIVSRGSAKFVGTDSLTTVGAVAGVAAQQSPNVTFDATSLNGNYAFLLTGSAPGGAIATAGSFSADGNGHLTANTGVLDENINGVATADLPFVQVPLPGGTFSGSYTVDSSGHGVVKFTAGTHAYNLVFYLSKTGNAVLQETDPGRTSDGSFVQQQSAAFSLASIQGSYALQTTGLLAASAQTIAGDLSADGLGAISSGTIDINTAPTLTAGQAVTGAYLAPAANGRAALTLNPSTDFAVYVVNSTQAIIVGITNGRLAAGDLFRQF